MTDRMTMKLIAQTLLAQRVTDGRGVSYQCVETDVRRAARCLDTIPSETDVASVVWQLKVAHSLIRDAV